MLQAACNSFASLLVLRFLSGAAEACSDPAFMLITAMWYPRRSQLTRYVHGSSAEAPPLPSAPLLLHPTAI